MFGDIWDYNVASEANCIGITTNGTVKSNGACVMGRGVALQAKLRVHGIDRQIGRAILTQAPGH
mgnify:CR=1 FL=1